MNWPSLLLAGLAGTLVLTTLEAGAQQLHLTRMSLPYLLGAAFTPSRDRARVVGFLVHLVNGQVVIEKGKHTGARPGKALRHQP